MQEKTIVYDANGKIFGKKMIVFDDVKDIRVLSNPLAWRIMELLSHRPMYPAEIAKNLQVYEQSVYYYVRKLLSNGAIEEVTTNLVKGGTARLYRSSCPSFGIEMNWGEKQLDFQAGVQDCAGSFRQAL